MDHYLRGATVSAGSLYLPSKQTIVRKFADIVEVIESAANITLNKDFHYVLNHYAHVPFPWKEDLQAWSTNK